MATSVLPRLVVLNVPKAGTDTCVYRKDDGSVVAGDDNMFSMFVKIEVERVKDDDRRVHLRFTYNNKYWQKSANYASIVALSKKLDEDTKKPSCTLFEVNQQSNNVVYFCR